MKIRVGRSARGLLAAVLCLGLSSFTRPVLADGDPARPEVAEASPDASLAEGAAIRSSAIPGSAGIEETPPTADLILDAAVLRPFRAAKVLMGFGMFLASLPMYAVAWDVPDAWNFLVGGPFEDAFLTPLGRI